MTTDRLIIRAPVDLFLLFVVVLAGSTRAADDDRRQSRPHSVLVSVPCDKIIVDDGDTIQISWKTGDAETVRILGIDAPEVRHIEHDIPLDQPFGR
jgi:endonuclease YncB( thermonuclease family)